MKITKSQLKQIIEEEIEKVISADDLYLAEMFNTMSVPDEDTEAFKNCPKGQWQYGEKDDLTRKPTYGWCKPIQEKEEPENLYENEIKITDQDMKAGKDLADSPVGNLIFTELDKDPNVQAALQNAMNEFEKETKNTASEKLPMKEDGFESGPTTRVRPPKDAFGNVGGQAAVVGGVLGAAAVSEAATIAFWTGVLTKSLAPAAAGVLTALGIGAGGMAAGALVGYLIYKGLIKLKAN